MKGKLSSILLSLLLVTTLTWFMLPAFRASRITVDGDPSDWVGAAPTPDNTETISEYEYIWTDEVGDDTGNGTYTYPTSAVFTSGEADLKELRITWDPNYVYFLLTFDDITDEAWNVTGEQAETTAVALCIDTDQVGGSGYDLVDDGSWGIRADIRLPSEAYWEYLIEIIFTDVRLWRWEGSFVTEVIRDFSLAVDTTVYETIEFAVPIGASGLPDPTDATWRFSVFMGIETYKFFREVHAIESQWYGGGGADHEYDPNAYDAAFFVTRAAQETALNGFDRWDYAVVSAYTDIPMNLLFLPPAEHDLSVSSMEAPSLLTPSESTMVNATVWNLGSNNETNVEVRFIVDGDLEDNITISLLASICSEDVSFPWTAPETPDIYNLTIYAVPVPGEEIIDNNARAHECQVFSGQINMVGIDTTMSGSDDRIATFNITVSLDPNEPKSYTVNLAVSQISPGSGFLSDFNSTFSENSFMLDPGQSREVTLTLEYLGTISYTELPSGTHTVNVQANFIGGETPVNKGDSSTFYVFSAVPPIGGPPSPETPDWVKRAVFYQIFPERFRDGNPNNNAKTGDVLWQRWGTYAESKSWGWLPSGSSDWFGGDLQGVQEKASYLADLGITAIWFNPTMDSTDNHGYTVIDYKSVSRYFGIHHRGAGDELVLDYNASLDVFRNMTEALDEYGINVVLDGVFNHCSAKNKWFDVDNDFATDGAYESESSPWYDWFVFYDWPDSYKCWWSVRQMPEPKEVDDFKDYIYRDSDSVLKFWDDLGVNGWRLDCGPDVSDEFWREFRTHYKGINPEGFILGEAWGDSSHWLQGDQWDSTMNYPFRGAVLDWANGGSVSNFDGTLNDIRSWYSEEVFYTLFNILGSHDITRVLTALGDNKAKLKLSVIFQMTYPGVPVVYYGDEVGMTGGGDPDCRRCYPWPDTGGSPDMDLFDHYKKLIGIRKSHPVLSVGTLETRLVDNAKKVYVLARRHDSSVAILIYNNGGASQTVTVDVSNLVADGSILHDALNNETYTVSGGHVTVETEGMWANILLSAPIRDVAVTSIEPSNTIVGAGYPVDVNVTIENQGGCTEIFSVTAFYGNSVIGSQMVSNLAPGAATTLTFKWNTTGVSPGNYSLKAEASVVPNETDTTDNFHVNGIVRIIHAQFTFATLYSVNLYVNGTLVEGSYLKAKFYSYSGIYQAESTVWSGTTPTQIELSENVSHPLGLPIEIVSLVLTYENGTTISTITNFVMRRSQLMARLTQLDLLWITEPETRIDIMKEIVAIDGQWPYAPP